jgi:hypothetical protein
MRQSDLERTGLSELVPKSADPRSSRRSLSAEGATLAGPLLWIRGRLGASRRRFVGNYILVPGRVLVDVVPAARER